MRRDGAERRAGGGDGEGDEHGRGAGGGGGEGVAIERERQRADGERSRVRPHLPPPLESWRLWGQDPAREWNRLRFRKRSLV